MRLIVVVGARPNVVKVGPLLPALERSGIFTDVAFTGSRSAAHPDDSGDHLSFYGVAIAAPRWFLDVGVGTDAVETGRAMIAFEELFARERPDAVLVIGDVSATLAAALSAAKLGIPVVHLDAGLRCGSLAVAEEINRVLVSRIAALHLAPTESALENLEDEGIDPERIHFVGNIMAESVMRQLDDLRGVRSNERFGMVADEYVLASFHRPENIQDRDRMQEILAGLGSCGLPVVAPDGFAIRESIESLAGPIPDNVRMVDAVPYGEMLALERDAAVIVTDSSGVQEESCVIGTPCLTVRECTEQTATLDVGSNTLLAADRGVIAGAIGQAATRRAVWSTPKRWDRAVSDRVVRALKRGVRPLE